MISLNATMVPSSLILIPDMMLRELDIGFSSQMQFERPLE